MKNFSVLVVIGMAALAYLFFIQAQDNANEQSTVEVTEERHTHLHFSTTQVWDEEYIKVLEAGQEWVTFYKPKLSVAPPPTEPAEIEEELRILHSYIEMRTPEKIWEISSEIEVEDALFDKQYLEDILKEKTETKKLLKEMFDRFEPIEVAFKKEFDRVRPSVYDQTLGTVIQVPGHPAYPSYHAADSTIIALLLGELNPEKSDVYLQDVERISRNREIAGVHYPSDSIAGQMLARDFYEIIQNEEWFSVGYEAALNEW